MIKILLSVALCSASFSIAAFSQEFNPLSIFGQKKKAYIEPEGYYRAVFPAGFHCDASVKRVVRCYGNRKGHQALFVIAVVDVPKSANSAVVGLRELKKYKKTEHFHLLSKRNIKMNKIPGVSFVYSYDQLGNVQYPMGVQNFFWVKNGKLISIRFEARLAAFRTYEKDLRVFFRNFYPASIGEDGKPNWKELQLEQNTRADESKKRFGG